MANVLTSFLVGIGLDTTEFSKGSKEVSSGLDSIKSKALGLGTVVAGAFGLAKMAGDFTGTTDKLGKFGQTFGLAADNVAGFGRAIQLSGGEFDSAMNQLEQIEKWRAAFKIGDTSWFKDAGLAGVDYNAIITSTDALQALLSQADKFKAASPQMRLNMMNALGIDPATLRLLSQGRAGAAELIEKYKAMRPVTEDATKASAEYNKQLLDLKTNMGALTDQLAMKVLPLLNDMLSIINSTPQQALKKVSQQFLVDASGRPVMGQRSAPLSPEDMAAGLKKGSDTPPLMRLYKWLSSSPDKGGIDLSGGQRPLSPNGVPMLPRGVASYYPNGPAMLPRDSAPRPLDMPTGPAVMPLSPSATNRVAAEAATQAKITQTQAQPPIIVHTHLNLDGREIDNRIVEVNQRGHRATLDDVRSTTSR